MPTRTLKEEGSCGRDSGSFSWTPQLHVQVDSRSDDETLKVVSSGPDAVLPAQVFANSGGLQTPRSGREEPVTQTGVATSPGVDSDSDSDLFGEAFLPLRRDCETIQPAGVFSLADRIFLKN